MPGKIQTDFEYKSKKLISMKKSLWDKILKVIIAIASAVLGALGANAMNV